MKIALHNTSLSVSPLALGTVNFGSSTCEKDSFYQMDRYKELGNFIDTAHVYGDWSPVEKNASERVIGRWLKSSGMKGKMVISSKGAHPIYGDPAFRPRLSKAEIEKDLNESLEYLGVDAIDIYFLHRDDISLSVEEIIETMEGFRKDGKIRYYGVSNWRRDRIEKAQKYAEMSGYTGISCNQLMWSLAKPVFERIEDKTLVEMDQETYRYHTETQMSVMAYRSIAKGLFSHMFEGTPVRKSAAYQYDQPINSKIYDSLVSLSSETGLPITALTLSYFLNQPFPSVAIASFSNEKQLSEGLDFLARDYDPAVSKALQSLRTDLI
ncbi:MAG: aldo/keto reductase [Clostridia bacterium]|nr:aldo/keto reductase [Clostridia bacterium]